MEQFIKCISQMNKVRYDYVIKEIEDKKIPCAFFSSAPVESALDFIKNLTTLNININVQQLITVNTPPRF